jgi:hypothetical protein
MKRWAGGTNARIIVTVLVLRLRNARMDSICKCTIRYGKLNVGIVTKYSESEKIAPLFRQG